MNLARDHTEPTHDQPHQNQRNIGLHSKTPLNIPEKKCIIYGFKKLNTAYPTKEAPIITMSASFFLSKKRKKNEVKL